MIEKILEINYMWNVLINNDNSNIHEKEHGSLPIQIARTLTARRICLGRSKSSILI